MKRLITVYILLAGLLLWAGVACTPPPPENPKDQEPNINAESTDDGTNPDEATGDKGPQEGETVIDPTIIEGEDGSTSTGMDGTSTEGEPGETSPGATPGEFPKDFFASYTSWPPESITAEDIEVLNKVVVVFETTKGIIKIKVFPEQAPINSANFVKLTNDGFYDGLKFHRVVQNFMSQGGDPDGTGAGGPGYTLPAEILLPHKAGSVAAARQGDNTNPERRSSGSQFYFVHTNQSGQSLDGQYTVFGQIMEGIDVNLSLSVNSTGPSSIPGAPTDSIIRAWVEME